METIRWLATLVLGGFFIGLTVFNWRYFWKHTRKREDEMSPVPLVGGVLGIVTLFVCPFGPAWHYWWVPLFIDFGSIPYALWTAYVGATNRD